MSNKEYRIFATTLYIISLLILFMCIFFRLTSYIFISTRFRLILLLIISLLIYISGFILTRKLNYNNRILKINLVSYILIYTVIIFSLTLFDEIYGRQGLILINWNKDLLNFYFKTSFNVIPFKTINLYISGYINGLITFKSFFINIFGNFCAFMPYSIFLPLMFKSMGKYYKFLIFIILFVVVIELLQFVTMSGACDIDDLILNVSGALVAYFIFKQKNINRFIRKILLCE